MKRRVLFVTATVLMVLFLAWTILIKTIDVQPSGPKGSLVGFSTLNTWFHSLTGVHMGLYNITDWLGLVPFCLCALFGFVGLVQWIQRKNILKVDCDIIILGIYYILVIASYFLFNMFPINYRPILIEGCLEPSYPSSTTLLTLTVMPSVIYQLNNRIGNKCLKTVLIIISGVFAGFMVIARLVCGVHWVTDIIGGFILSIALFVFYLATTDLYKGK